MRSRAVMRRRSSTARGASVGSAWRSSGCTNRAVAHARHRGCSSPFWDLRATTPDSAHHACAPRGSNPPVTFSATSAHPVSTAAASTHSSITPTGMSPGSASRHPPSAKPFTSALALARGLTRLARPPSCSASTAAAWANLPRSPPSGGPATRPSGLYQPSPNRSCEVCTPMGSPAGRNSTDTASFSGAGRMTRPRRCTNTRSLVVGARCITTAARVSSQPSVSRSALHSTSMSPSPNCLSTFCSSLAGVCPDTAAAFTPRSTISSARACACATVAVYATPARPSGMK